MVELELAHLPLMVLFMVTQRVPYKLLQQQTWEVLTGNDATTSFQVLTVTATGVLYGQTQSTVELLKHERKNCYFYITKENF